MNKVNENSSLLATFVSWLKKVSYSGGRHRLLFMLWLLFLFSADEQIYAFSFLKPGFHPQKHFC